MKTTLPKPAGWMLRKPSIDLGLDVIRAVQQPGQTLSTRAIAEVCGCTNTCIWMIEQRALRKVRRALQQNLRQSAYEFSQNTTR